MTLLFRTSGFAFFLMLIFLSCDRQDTGPGRYIPTIDSEQLLNDIRFLASDELEGRRTGTEGARLAREYIESRFRMLGLNSFGESYRQPFRHTDTDTGADSGVTDAVNLIGYVEGSLHPDRYLIVTAHYDHLGMKEGVIYNGADDNASGTGGLLAAARYFSHYTPQNSMIFIAFDAEEQGLAGARHFVENPVVSLERIVLTVNMDMISTNFQNELYVAGTYHHPFLKPLIEEFVRESPVDILFGHDSPESEQDWTTASDHGPFHQQGIPFIYFGVEDHEHYHQPTDTYDTINPTFYTASTKTIIEVLAGLDKNLGEVARASGRFQ